MYNDLNQEKLLEELSNLRQLQMKLTMQHASNQLEGKTHRIRQVRRDIARVKTFLAQHNVKV